MKTMIVLDKHLMWLGISVDIFSGELVSHYKSYGIIINDMGFCINGTVDLSLVI